MHCLSEIVAHSEEKCNRTCILYFCLQYCFLFLARVCDFMSLLYHGLFFCGSGLIYTYIYKYIFILKRSTLQWSCFFNGLSLLKEYKVIIHVLNAAAKPSSEISYYRVFVRYFGKLILRREYVLLKSFKQARVNVCTVGSRKIRPENSF